MAALLGELRASRPTEVELAGAVVRHARRQRSLVAILGLFVTVARTLPDVVALAGRRR